MPHHFPSKRATALAAASLVALVAGVRILTRGAGSRGGEVGDARSSPFGRSAVRPFSWST